MPSSSLGISRTVYPCVPTSSSVYSIGANSIFPFASFRAVDMTLPSPSRSSNSNSPSSSAFPSSALDALTVTLPFASGKWFVSVCYSYEISGITPAPITKHLKGIGLDYSSPHLLIDNKGRTADQLITELAAAAHNGNLNGTPRYKHWYRENEALIARRARELARKRNSLASKDGVPVQSKNYWRAKATLARRQEKVANRRRDFFGETVDAYCGFV